MGTADVEAVWRIESARIVAALTRFTGDFGLAEEASGVTIVPMIRRRVRSATAANPTQGSAIG